jgi:hypothetical protein
MDSDILVVLFILFVILVVITIVGHVIWVVVRELLRFLFNLGRRADDDTPPSITPPRTIITSPPDDPVKAQLKDLAATERLIVRFCGEGKLTDEVYEHLLAQIRAERERLTQPAPSRVPPTPIPKPIIEPQSAPSAPSAVPVPPLPERWREPASPPPPSQTQPPPPPPPQTPPPPPRAPRRSFSEVLNAFMEESNIRWGEIVGGLLIIGCSTALVVSLWAQISQIPVLKFLIFTTVTAILFGIGLYTEHRWKLPTTSRGILTIATLLVPLNFLAIAAVSASNTSGALVIGSELAAPAIFLCLVYFAGRVITPGCAHLLSAGVLGSSIGQLLVRHFASAESAPGLLIFLGAFPVLCYVVTVGLALRVVLSDHEIDENETTTVFTVLGTMSFAALLPFGLLLYKSGPLGLTMMYLAPLVTMWGLPMLATGTILWRRINNKELVASRTAGTALGIVGVFVVLAGMILAWPNPASIVPAALLNFAIFTALAVFLELPVAHLIAASCFGLAYLVAFHVFAGRISWENLRVMSLLDVSLSVTSGQAWAGTFVLFIAASEWLSRLKRRRDADYYLIAAGLLATLSLVLVTWFGKLAGSYHGLWIVYGIYALGAFWIAWRRRLVPLAWLGSGLLVVALADGFAYPLELSFPWQTALFTHATICAIAAILTSRYRRFAILSAPLNASALIAIVLGVVSLFQANQWEQTAMQAQRVFWIAGTLLILLWLNRRRLLFNVFQIALICAAVLSVKAALQQFEWYSYLPHAFLHPTALQIQGTVLALIVLGFIGLRMLVRRMLARRRMPNDGTSWLNDAWRLLDDNYAIDRILASMLIGAFVLLAVYGALAGVTQELAAWGSGYPGFDVAGFPHQEALGLGSWIVLGLLTVAMLVSFWERRSEVYLLGALVVLSAAIPLIAGLFETQVATATAWRWLAALFLVGGSVALWYRNERSTNVRTLLIFLTVAPLLVLTFYPALRTIYYLPVQGPISGIFARLSDGFSYGAPLVLVALVMVGYALRERRPEFSFYAGLLFNATVTLAFLLAVVGARGAMDRVVVVRLAQLNAITFAVYALPWLSTRGRWLAALDHEKARLAGYLLKWQIAFAVVLHVLLYLPIVVDLIGWPTSSAVAAIAAGSFLGWLAFVVTLGAVAWLILAERQKLPASLVAGALWGLSCLAAFSVADVSGWVALHTLTVAMTASTGLLVMSAFAAPDGLVGWPQKLFNFGGNWQARSRQFAVITGAMALFLSLRTVADLDMSRWWSVGPLLALTVVSTTLNWQTLRRRYLYIAGWLLSVATTLWWIFINNDRSKLSSFLFTNLIVMSLAGILWLWLELRARRRRETPARVPALSFHNVVAIAAMSLLILIVALGHGLPRRDSLLLDMPRLVWFGYASVLALMAAALWDRIAKYAVAGLYVMGLLAAAIGFHQLNLSAERLPWSVTTFLALYSLAVAVLWRRREEVIEFAGRAGIPRRITPQTTELKWLSVVTIIAVITVTAFAYAIISEFLTFGLRFTAALAVAMQFFVFVLLAEGNVAERWRRFALATLVIGLVLLGWSWLTPGVDSTWLNRSVILMVEAFGLTALYALLLNKVAAEQPDWTTATRASVPWLLGAGVVALFFCLGTEVFYQLSFGTVRINPFSLVAIGVTLAAAVIICVLFALSPAHDPLGLSERGRMVYVYVAEVMLALLFLHIRLTLPWLFTGFIERYWPLAVMVIAYLGVVTSESLKRRKLLVLAQPLERTGVFLPLLPVLGFWLASSEVDFSLLLFVIGGLYGLVAVLRRSFVFGVMAAVAGNAGLWYILHRTADYQFLQHPQLWLIPVALSVLLAAYLNEDNLSEDQMTSIRYLSLVTIYAASTADIFINGVANSPWLPLILGSFSLAGVFAGILFRVRGMLLLGSVFLLLSIITMIWYASDNFGWTWLWYVAGIVTGATIIFMFAVFEKKRSEVMRVVEGLKEWDR